MSDDPLKEWKSTPQYRLLQAEVSALETRLDSDNRLGRVIRELWDERQTAPGEDEDENVAFYRHVLAQMLMGKFERIVPPDPFTDLDSFGANLMQLNRVLDQKFAEVRALTEISHEINEGIFIGDVLDHIYATFRPVIPYDRIGFATLETDDGGRRVLRSHWTRADYPVTHPKTGFHLPLDQTSLGAVADSGHPRIIADLPAYLEDHPESVSARLLVQEGVRSSLTCPLIAKGKLVGFLFFSSRTAGAYQPKHAEIFMALAGDLALTLEKSGLYEQLTLRNQFIRNVFGRYISDDIAEALLADPGALKMGGRKCCVTVLLSDVRGFTSMSENMEPEEVVSTLNACFNVMVDIIHKHNGTIDNIIGDALMVIFGAPVARADDPQRAVACALDMQAAMAEVNARIAALGLPELHIGIGLNTGHVVAGNIGSEAHAKYSVIGAPVNLAARLEAKAGPGEVLISEATYQAVKDHVQVREQREVQAKGFTGPVRAYSVF